MSVLTGSVLVNSRLNISSEFDQNFDWNLIPKPEITVEIVMNLNAGNKLMAGQHWI